MRSPLIGLLLQRGHIADLDTLRQLTQPDQRPLPLHRACRELADETVARRRSWRGMADTARRLFLINSP